MVGAKQKKEIGIIVGCVLLVAVVGLFTTLIAEKRVTAVAGAAVEINSELPTYPGVVLFLKEYCSPIEGDGTCDALCGEKTCIPTQENCDVSVSGNSCLCCSSP